MVMPFTNTFARVPRNSSRHMAAYIGHLFYLQTLVWFHLCRMVLHLYSTLEVSGTAWKVTSLHNCMVRHCLNCELQLKLFVYHPSEPCLHYWKKSLRFGEFCVLFKPCSTFHCSVYLRALTQCTGDLQHSYLVFYWLQYYTHSFLYIA